MDIIIKCSSCNKIHEEGIILLNKYICRQCEIDIVTVSEEELKYEKFKRDIKHMWKGLELETLTI